MSLRSILPICALLVAVPAGAQDLPHAKADLIGLDGASIGTVVLTGTPDGGVLLMIEASGLEPGVHALHIHETGACEPPFASAGDHFAPRGREHGLRHTGGAHAGDLLNLHVGDDGTVRAERLAPHVTLKEGTGGLFDADGSAVVLHGGADDYRSQPSGAAGDPVACGVIRR